MSLVIRVPIATLAPGNNGLMNRNAAFQTMTGIGIMRRGSCIPSKTFADHLGIGEDLCAGERIELVGGPRAGCCGHGAGREILGVHGLSQAGTAADERHEAEYSNDTRQRRDVGVAAGVVDQCRPQDCPFGAGLFASRGNLALGIGEPLQQLPFRRDLAVELGHDTGRTEHDDAPQPGVKQARQRFGEQDRVSRAVHQRKGRKFQGLGLFEIATKPVDAGSVSWRPRQCDRPLSGLQQIAEDVPADEAGRPDDEAPVICGFSCRSICVIFILDGSPSHGRRTGSSDKAGRGEQNGGPGRKPVRSLWN